MRFLNFSTQGRQGRFHLSGKDALPPYVHLWSKFLFVQDYVFNFNRNVIILNEFLMITSIYRTRDSHGGSVSPPPLVQLRTVEVRNPNYSSLAKGIYRRLILFYLNNWKIFRFHDFMGDFRLSEKFSNL